MVRENAGLCLRQFSDEILEKFSNRNYQFKISQIAYQHFVL